MPRFRPQPKHLYRVVSLALVVVVMASCSSGGSSSKGAAHGSPMVIGFINQENTAEGSFPEVRTSAEAAVRYVNAQRGGVHGHPIQLESCATDGSPESSQACANRLLLKKPIAVFGGLDFGAAASIPVFDTAGIPYVGASPTLGDELTASASFMFTGGAAADLLGQAQYVTDTLHVKKVAVIYIDLPGLLSTAVDVAKDVLGKKGVTDVNAQAEEADTADFTPALNSVTRNKPDVILAVFPPQGCSRIMQARQALSIKTPMMFPGVCAAQGVLDASGGGGDGAYFTSGFYPYDSADPDVVTYRNERTHYGDDDPPSNLSQAGFGEVMDLQQVLSEMTVDINPSTVIAALRTTKNHHGFMSHPFTCDRQQVLLLTAICNSNVRLFQYDGSHFTDTAKDWVNGADLIRVYTG